MDLTLIAIKLAALDLIVLVLILIVAALAWSVWPWLKLAIRRRYWAFRRWWRRFVGLRI